MRSVAFGVMFFAALLLSACNKDEQDNSESANSEVQNSISPNEYQRGDEGLLTASPRAVCGEGALEEGAMQGRVSQNDYDSGRASVGFKCNTELVGSFATGAKDGYVGGYKVESFVDSKGQRCAFYDTTFIAPFNLADGNLGVNVLDMSDSSKPRLARRLFSPAMISPHESLVLNKNRGILAAALGNPAFGPGVVDLYDIKDDCLNPVLKSSTLLGVFGHESGISEDGCVFRSKLDMNSR